MGEGQGRDKGLSLPHWPLLWPCNAGGRCSSCWGLSALQAALLNGTQDDHDGSLSCQTHLWAAPHSDQLWDTGQNHLTRLQWLHCQRDWSVPPSLGQSQVLAKIPGMSQALVLQLQGIYLRAPLTGSVCGDSRHMALAPSQDMTCIQTVLIETWRERFNHHYFHFVKTVNFREMKL